METEIWKDIKGYDGKYRVSSAGRVKTVLPKEHIRKFGNNGHGYQFVPLSIDGKVRNHYVHRLVAEAFLENPYNKHTVNHNDGNKLNNNVSNLSWMTQSENSQHGFDTGLIEQKRGVDNKISVGVCQYNYDGILLNTFDSIKQASECTGIHVQCISTCCAGMTKRAGNYQWRYKKYNLPSIEPIPTIKSNGEKPINMFDKYGHYIRMFKSITEASREMGICHSSISDNCNYRLRTAGGYVWKFR